MLRAQERVTSTSGVTTLTLPVDYTDFEFVEFVVSDPSNNVTDMIRRSTAWLAAQNDADGVKLGADDADEAGSQQWLTWTPSTRVVGTGGQHTSAANRDLRIQSARLYDTKATLDPDFSGLVTTADLNAAEARLDREDSCLLYTSPSPRDS